MAEIGMGGEREPVTNVELLLRIEALEAGMKALTAQLAAARGAAPVAAMPTVPVLPAAPLMPAGPMAEAVPVAAAYAPMLPKPVGAVAAEPATTGKPAASLETKFGAQVLSKIGVFLLLIGAAWFLKWSMDNGWVGPVGRVLAGLLAGAGVVVWSERFRRKGFAGFSYALKAVGSGTLYLSLWAAFQLYHLMPSWVALLAMVGVTVWNGVMAWSQDAELLAGYALFGAYLTPALLSTGGDHEIFLFTYLWVIAAGLAALLRAKPWSRLVLGALPMTAIYFAAWYTEHFDASREGVTLLFALMLWAAFAVIPLVAEEAEGQIVGVFTPLFAALFGALTVYSVLADSGGREWEAMWAVGFAAVYLGMTRVRPEGLAAALHLSLAVVFLTVTIPLKVKGRGITLGWLAEGVALLRLCGLAQIPERARTLLRVLACAALLLGVGGALIGPVMFEPASVAFWNRDFATSLGACVALAGAMYFAAAMQADGASKRSGEVIGASALVLMNVVLLAAMYREIDKAIGMQEYSDFAFSAWMLVQGAVQLAVGFWKKAALARWIGLVVLGVTAIKAFGFDIRNLGTGYRVVSYLGLGVVLMVVSFAYQKNWLTPADGRAANQDEAAK